VLDAVRVDGREKRPCAAELLTGEAEARRQRLEIPAMEAVPASKSCSNRKRKVRGCRYSIKLREGAADVSPVSDAGGRRRAEQWWWRAFAFSVECERGTGVERLLQVAQRGR
jgi:hypothetical protein